MSQSEIDDVLGEQFGMGDKAALGWCSLV